ncbi:MAG: hypothetical protein HY858_00425 [Candidatus Solibacter usitatus]|nr:hypothetical protein [Candidatus Solibacter usitatus]
MFFKRAKAVQTTFSEQLEALRSAGYAVVQAGSNARVTKGNLAATLAEGSGGKPVIEAAGLAVRDEMAVLTDLGFQKIFLTASGRTTPALAEHLHALHGFREELGERLGLTSHYNEGLGTTNEKHLYDRVKGRDEGTPRRAWEKG